MPSVRRQFICAWCEKQGPAKRGSTTYCSKACLGAANGARAAYAGGRRICDIAEQYGLGDGRASEIVHGKAYTHVPGAIPTRKGAKVLASTGIDISVDLVRVERELDAHGEYRISSLLQEEDV